MGRSTTDRGSLRFVVAYWILLGLTSVFIASALLVVFLWGPVGISEAIFVFWRSEMIDVVSSDDVDRCAERSRDRMVGAFQGLSAVSTGPLIVLNVAWLVWGALLLRRRRSR